MIIYIASFFETRSRLLPIREALQAQGHTITSTWLDEGKKPAEQSKFKWWFGLATKDLYDIKRSEAIILDTLDVNPRGGREVEWGYATGSVRFKARYLVGPMRNVFHTLADVQFHDWQAALKYFEYAEKDPWRAETYKLIEPWIADPIEEARKHAQENQAKTGLHTDSSAKLA